MKCCRRSTCRCKRTLSTSWCVCARKQAPPCYLSVTISPSSENSRIEPASSSTDHWWKLDRQSLFSNRHSIPIPKNYSSRFPHSASVCDVHTDPRRQVTQGLGQGCVYARRCRNYRGSICDEVVPPWRTTASGHAIRCHIPLTELAAESLIAEAKHPRSDRTHVYQFRR